MKTACLKGGGYTDEAFFYPVFQVIYGCCISSHSGQQAAAMLWGD